MDTWKQTKLGPPNFRILDWDEMREGLRAESYDDNWETAIAGIEGRFRERFIRPAHVIQEHDKNDKSTYPEGRGFAIVAIDCLLLESLHGYKTGKRTKTSGETSAPFEDILTTSVLFEDAFADAARGPSEPRCETGFFTTVRRATAGSSGEDRTEVRWSNQDQMVGSCSTATLPCRRQDIPR